MFVINDNDLPITVAEKIITGQMPCSKELFAMRAALIKSVVGEELSRTCDMFTIEEIAEIAGYLNNYVASHPKGD